MKFEYHLVYNGHSADSEENRLALIDMLKNQGVGSIVEVDDFLGSPPFVVKRSNDRQELEQDLSTLQNSGITSLLIQAADSGATLRSKVEQISVPATKRSAKLLAKSSVGQSPFTAFYSKYAQKLSEILASLEIASVECLAQEIVAARQRNGQIIVIGNGGSAAAASHLVTDLSKQRFNDERSLFRAFSLADNVPHFSATANDFGYEKVFTQQLKNILQPQDLLIAISSSGNSPNILGAVDYANAKGAKTFSIVGFDGGELQNKAIQSVFIPTQVGQYGFMEDVVSILTHIVSIYIYEQDSKRFC